MPKLIDLTDQQPLIDLLVDTALLGVWYGLAQPSKLIIEWMRHRSDDAPTVAWIEAYRCLRAERYADAEEALVQLRARAPDDSCTTALLAALLHETGKPGVPQLLSELASEGDTLDPGVRAIAAHLQTHSTAQSGRPRVSPQQQRVMMG